MNRILLASLAALLAGCSDGTGPPRVAEVRIFLGAAEPADTTVEVGSALRLHADLRDAAGAALPDRAATWRSTDPAVVAVDTAGRVTALSTGRALVLAEADAASDTLRMDVVMPPDAFVACATTDPGLVMAVGQVHTVQASHATLLCLRGPEAGAGAEYVFVPFHAAASGGRLRVEVAANGVTAASEPPSPSRGASLPLAAATSAESPGDRFHLGLRAWEGENLGALRARRGGALRSTAAAPRALAVGDTLHLNANANSACSDPDLRVARVEAVTGRAIVVADTLNPADGFTRAEYQRFAGEFDEVVWPVDTENFGEPSDIDGNGRVLIFFTRAVNDLTEPNSGSYVGGFFWGRDYNPTAGCAGSNAAEIFYMLVPDPERGEREPAFGKGNVSDRTLAVIAHEFQHLINYSRRIANEAPVDEAVWLNEGLSHVAEELVFYRRTGLGPGRNLDIAEIRTPDTRRQAANRYMVANMGRLASHLERPQGSSPLASGDDLATRGAAWAFLRYAADREAVPGSQPAFWRRLVESRTSGIENLRDAIGEDPLPWLQDWTVAVYTDDAVPGVEARHEQPSWDYRSMLSALYEEGYPLETIELRAGEANTEVVHLPPGGAAYLRFAVPPGQRAAVRTTSRGATPPPTLRFAIVRTR